MQKYTTRSLQPDCVQQDRRMSDKYQVRRESASKGYHGQRFGEDDRFMMHIELRYTERVVRERPLTLSKKSQRTLTKA